MPNQPIAKLARLLMLKHPWDLEAMILNLERLTKKKNLTEKILELNSKIFEKQINKLKVSSRLRAEEVFEALMEQVESAENDLSAFFRKRGCNCADARGVKRMLKLAQTIHPQKQGFFLKPTAAKKLLKRHPPRRMMGYLKYPDPERLLAREDIFEIYAALRFSEDGQWMNRFLEYYKKLKPSDFEKRKVKVLVLDPDKWYKLARTFVEKKYHNLSHSKEMGIIFEIPVLGQFAGLNLRAFALILHYFSEIEFYSKYFEYHAQNPENFGKKLVTGIKGDVKRPSPKYKKTLCWHILQRYLAKDPKQDWRFFAPHIMPEAIHWRKAFHSIHDFAKKYKIKGLYFWGECYDWVGMSLTNRSGKEIMITLNFEDLIFSYAMNLHLNNYYRYHWREALMNRVFYQAVGTEKMEELVIKNMDKGMICSISNTNNH